MRNGKHQCSRVLEKNVAGNEKFQGNIHVRLEESTESWWFSAVNNVMSRLWSIQNFFRCPVSCKQAW